jgi:hypothetical protein
MLDYVGLLDRREVCRFFGGTKPVRRLADARKLPRARGP